MAEGLGEGLKTATGDIKRNWLPFLLLGAGLVIAILWYDHKSGGNATKKLAGLPVIGKLFA